MLYYVNAINLLYEQDIVTRIKWSAIIRLEDKYLKPELYNRSTFMLSSPLIILAQKYLM